MKHIIKSAFLVLCALSVHISHTAKINIQVGGGSKYPKKVAIFWKVRESFVASEYREMGSNSKEFDSSWTNGIAGVRWMEWIASQGKMMHYECRLNIPAISWRREPAWFIIFDNGYVTFDVGNGVQEQKVMSSEEKSEEKRKMTEKGWIVVDY